MLAVWASVAAAVGELAEAVSEREVSVAALGQSEEWEVSERRTEAELVEFERRLPSWWLLEDSPFSEEDVTGILAELRRLRGLIAPLINASRCAWTARHGGADGLAAWNALQAEADAIHKEQNP